MRRGVLVKLLVLVGMLVVLSVVAVFAQEAETGTQPSWLQWLASILQNSVVLWAVGMLADRWKPLASIVANKVIPYLQTAIAALGVLLGFAQHIPVTSMLNLLASPAYAFGGHVPHVAVFGIGGFVGGLISAVGAGAWSAAQAHLWHRLYSHKVLGASPSFSVK
jgi:hypothetical protein